MQNFSRVSCQQVQQWIDQGQSIQLLDTRDEQSFAQGHIRGAASLARQGLAAVTDELDQQQPVVIYCYHGISSQQVAAYLAQLGYEDVYSMDGGFEQWRVQGESVADNE